MDKSSVYIIIPCKNEESRISKVLKQLLKLNYYNTIVVDDGSDDGSFDTAKRLSPHVLKHSVNLGVGAAIRTGIHYALELGAEYIVTIDGDAQHDPRDIDNLLSELLTGKDLVIGSRFKHSENKIPFIRRGYNFIANIIAYLATGVLLSDSQSGLRCMTRTFALSNPIDWNGYEYCIEMLKNIKIQKYQVSEFPIRVYYNKETLRKGQGLWTGIITLSRVVTKKFHR